jgi:alginate O-acetyltransferase complex protein AlgJ
LSAGREHYTLFAGCFESRDAVTIVFTGRISLFFRKLRTIFFLACIGLVPIGTILHWDSSPPLNENRQLATLLPWPGDVSQVKDYLPALMAYYRDHFFFRIPLIHQLMLLKINMLHISGVPEVILGKDNWLFLRLRNDPNSHDFAPLAPLSESELNAWQQSLEHRAAWLANRHIAYLLVIVPEKQTIYPEYLPAAMAALQIDPRIDQLLNRLAIRKSPLHVLDLRPSLLSAKPAEFVYMKYDTHWSPYGVFIVYQQIMSAIARLNLPKPTPILPPDHFLRLHAVGEGGDLANMLGVPEIFHQDINVIEPPPLAIPPRGKFQQLYIVDGFPGSPRLVMYHDSFGYKLIPLLARSFSHAAFFWGKHTLHPDFIATQRPDLVIDEMAERFVTGTPTEWTISPN